ncbi:creatininase family protein [Tsukamurella tyrosinosolvens]|uniref:creatininase family protein n=1 Tax=Tsukamurella tyrosinosolvens TaxID=57704 RepID=UPI000CA2E86D|nr:creatininase family protein [Tsukamurella tyrosinosolvens]AUN41816.1 creatininase [Tsukamurella tyrosinosolvens]
MTSPAQSDAAPNDEVRLERLTSAEIGRAIASGVRTAVLPLAAVEQHGCHLPLSMDADHADALAIRIASGLGDALALPTVRVGYSPHHLGFPGTLSIRAETLESICLDYGTHLYEQGFRNLVIFSGHIGNYPVLQRAQERLEAALKPLTVVVFTDGSAILNAWRRAAEDTASLGDRVGGHADLAETSVMLALHPERVRRAAYLRGYTGTVDDEFLSKVFDEGMRSQSPTGILGDPNGASALIGEACLAAVTDLIVAHAQSRVCESDGDRLRSPRTPSSQESGGRYE